MQLNDHSIQLHPIMFQPRLERGKVDRSRLTGRLMEARHKTCIVVRGPAGSGKTTLALQWRMQLVPFGYDFAWLTVPAGCDIDALLENLFATCNEVHPEIAREAAILYNRGDQRSSDEITIPLLNGITRHARELVLLLDDFHNIGDVRAERLVQTLLDYAPPHLHLVLVTRSSPSLSLSRLEESDGLLKLDFVDLRFTLRETEQFLQAHCPGLPAREARRLHELTDGWGAGLRLVSMDLKRGLQEGRGNAPVQNPGDFSVYFRNEVLSRLSTIESHALTCLAAAQRFNDGLCAMLFGPETGEALLNRLRRDNLFLIPFEGRLRDHWYRFHPLFRDALRERFDALPAAEQRRVHRLLGDWFARQQDLEESVRHWAAAGELEKAADLLERDARSLFLHGELRRLVRAVEQLPQEVLERRLSLRLWLAWSQLYHHQLAHCSRSLALLRSAQPDDDSEGVHHLTLLAGALAIQDDDTTAGQQLVPALEALQGGSDAILAGGRRNILGWLCIHLAQYDRAREILRGPAPFTDDGLPLLDSAFGSLLSECMLGYAYLREGDMLEAEKALQAALAHSDRMLGIFCEASCNSASFLASVLYERNRLDGLRTMLEPRLDVLERVALPEAVRVAGVARIRAYTAEGSFQEALSETERLQELSQRRGLVRLHAYAYAERSAVQLRLGDAHLAAATLDQLDAFIAGMPASGSAALRDMRALARWSRARWLAATERSAEALTQLEGLRESGLYAPARQKYGVRVDSMVAVLDARLGRQEAAQQRIAATLAEARRLGLVRTLLDLGPEALQLAEAAKVAGRLSPASAFYLDHLKLQAPAAGTAPTLSGDRMLLVRETLSGRERDVLRSLASTMSNKRIAQALGLSPETVKWHLKNIYGKLGVYDRDSAVAKARELGWIAAGEVAVAA